jgi:hypothetical protein
LWLSFGCVVVLPAFSAADVSDETSVSYCEPVLLYITAELLVMACVVTGLGVMYAVDTIPRLRYKDGKIFY